MLSPYLENLMKCQTLQRSEHQLGHVGTPLLKWHSDCTWLHTCNGVVISFAVFSYLHSFLKLHPISIFIIFYFFHIIILLFPSLFFFVISASHFSCFICLFIYLFFYFLRVRFLYLPRFWFLTPLYVCLFRFLFFSFLPVFHCYFASCVIISLFFKIPCFVS